MNLKFDIKEGRAGLINKSNGKRLFEIQGFLVGGKQGFNRMQKVKE